MNNVTLTGNAVRDIEIQYTPAGKEVARGTIAVRRNFKNSEGKYESDFIDFVCWGPRAKVLADYVRKGDKFGISGRLTTRTYENQEGRKIRVVEVNVEDFDLPARNSNPPSDRSENKPPVQYDNPFGNPLATGGTIDLSDDNLPF